MKIGKVESEILEKLEKHPLLFVVIDPLDHPSLEKAVETAKNAEEAGADAILIGGSIGVQGELLDNTAKMMKSEISLPIILFPGNIGTVTKYADAIYFMSLLNSTSPYWITGAQTLAAPLIKQYGIEPLSVGYAVVSPGGTVGWVGGVKPIPRNKPQIAASIGLAAQYMGFRFFITDAGSNPENGHIPLEMINAVSKTIDIPYVVAGGIRTAEQAKSIVSAGADILQVGTAFERDGSRRKIELMVRSIRNR